MGLDGSWSEEVTGILVGTEGVTSLLNTHAGTPALFTPPAEVVAPVLCLAPSGHTQIAAASDPAWQKGYHTGAHPKVRSDQYNSAALRAEPAGVWLEEPELSSLGKRNFQETQ